MKRYVATVVLALAGAVAWQWEGYSPVAYKDIVGIPTICRGHTGPDVKMGQRATSAQCDAYSENDLHTAYQTTLRCVPDELPTSVRAAYVSFTLNVGPGRRGVKDGMCALKSGATPSHVAMLNAGHYVQACQQLLQWSNAGGKFSRGINNRRKAEVELCLTDL